MKAVLLAINAKYVHSSLSVWVLAGGVRMHAHLPHDAVVVETTIKQDNEEIASSIAAHMPNVVGVSSYIWNAGKLPGLLKCLRDRLPDALFVLGGPEASFNAGYWLENGADFVIRGEGERSFPALLDSLSQGQPLQQVFGHANTVDTSDTSGIVDTANTDGPTYLNDTAYTADPYSEDYFRTLDGRIAYLETSRGCPFRCAFCLSGGSSARFFPLETAKDQISRLSRSGTRTIKLVDRTFNCDPKRAYELFEYIINLDTSCRFHLEVAPDLFEAGALELLASAPPGRIQLEAGLQSFHVPALRAVSRNVDLEKAESNIRALLRNRNIHIHIDLIAGLPYETLPAIQDGFDRAYALGAHTLQLGFLKLLHGSVLREQAGVLGIEYGADPPYEIIRNPWLSGDDILNLKATENALQHTHNKSRFQLTFKYVLSVSGLRPYTLFHTLGSEYANHGTPLDEYAGEIFASFAKLPNVCNDELRECMICDWLGMTKGENMPQVLKIHDKRQRQIAMVAERKLSRKLRRDETAVLPSGRGVFVDSGERDPVTGLYRLHWDT